MTNSDQNREQLDWLAFRFVSGELNSVEEAAFCQRMADEQAVREAVAEAVQLTQVIAFTEELEPVADRVELPTALSASSQQSFGRRRSVWMAIGGVCCLALVILIQAFSRLDERGGRRSASDGNGIEKMLAIAWSEIRSELSSEVSSEELAFDEDSSDSLLQQLTEDSAISTPTWILAAVGAPLGETSAIQGDNN